MTEVQLIEAVADKRIYRNDNERQRLAEAYNDVWARTGVSAATFDSSYTWWWGHPEAMKACFATWWTPSKTWKWKATGAVLRGRKETSRTVLPAVRLHRRLNDVVDGGVRPRLTKLLQDLNDSGAVVALVFAAACQAFA